MDNRYIIIFDGVCNFCNGAVNFIIKRDPEGRFSFTPMQSEIAQELIRKHNVPKVGFDTFLLIKNGRCYERTDAALVIARDLSGFWFLFGIFRIMPRPIRDYFYRLFARNRYAIFGRRELCRVPSVDTVDRFIG
ncbi:MAG: thiol-disulfide oxidoreductase DCC family protein [Thiotrichaceae bacterium]